MSTNRHGRYIAGIELKKKRLQEYCQKRNEVTKTETDAKYSFEKKKSHGIREYVSFL